MNKIVYLAAIGTELQKWFAGLATKALDGALDLGMRILLALVTLLIGAQLIKVVRKITKKVLQKADADLGVQQFLDSFIKFALYIILVFIIAAGFGVDAASIVALLGSAGVAVGLALQGSLSNLAGGVLILLLKPFGVGDYIKEDAAGNEGTVSEIHMFYTKLLTGDNKTIILPNGTLANTSMTNVSAADKRRVDITVGVSYNTDIKKAKEVLMGVLNAEPLALADKDKLVFVDSLGDSAVVLGVRCWVDKENYWTVKWRVTENVKYALDEAGIEIPFPQMDVHVKEK